MSFLSSVILPHKNLTRARKSFRSNLTRFFLHTQIFTGQIWHVSFFTRKYFLPKLTRFFFYTQIFPAQNGKVFIIARKLFWRVTKVCVYSPSQKLCGIKDGSSIRIHKTIQTFSANKKRSDEAAGGHYNDANVYMHQVYVYFKLYV